MSPPTSSPTTSISTALNTITRPMTAIFTPPSSCSSHWTYENQAANSVAGGLLLQDALYNKPDLNCFPDGFNGWGRAPSFIEVFSPGACPVGYTTAIRNYGQAVTTAVCCPSQFYFTSAVSSVNAGHKTAEYFGCTSIYTGGSTTVFAEAGGYSATLDGTSTYATVVSGPVTMWAQPITIEYQRADLSLFTTSSSTPSSTPQSTPSSTPSTTSSSAPSSPTASPTSLSISSSTSTSSAVHTSSTSSNAISSLSAGAIAGIATGAAAVLGMLIAIAILLQRRQSQTQSVSPTRDIQAGQASGGYQVESKPYHNMYDHQMQENAKKSGQFAQAHELQQGRYSNAELPDTWQRRHELPS